MSMWPDGANLAAGEKGRKILVINASTYDIAKSDWKYHTAFITDLAWSPDSQRLASVSLDTDIIVWDLAQPARKRVTFKGAHPTACVNAVAWTSDNGIITSGNDGCVRSFTYTAA